MKPSTYDRYRVANHRLDRLLDFVRGEHWTTNTIRLADGLTVRLHKLQDGSTNIEVIEDLGQHLEEI